MSQHQNDPEPNGLDDRFADWVDDRLDEQARHNLEAELARDPELRRQAEDYRATVQMVRENLTEHLVDDEPPDDLVTAVLERVRRERSPLFRLVPLVASLSAAAALVLMVFLLNQPLDRGTDPLDNLDAFRKVARYEARDEEDQPDDMVLKEPPRTKVVAGETKLDETLDRAPRFNREADSKLAKKSREMGGRDAKQEAAPVATEEEAEEEGVEAKDPAKVSDELRAVRAPRSRGRMGGRGGRGDFEEQADKDLGERYGIQLLEENQLKELRRITAQVFTAQQPVADAKPTAPTPLAQRPSRTQTKTGQDDYDLGGFAQNSKEDAEKKNKAGDTKPVAQVAVVVVQLAGPPALGQPGADRRERAVGRKPALHKDQQQVVQNFLGYLKQQPQSWAVGNEIRRQARALDLTRSLAESKTVLQMPQTGGGAATAQALLQPGDQLLLVSGSSREVQTLFLQLKTFLGRSKLDVAVQQLPRARFPGEVATFGARKYARKKNAEEMRFYLVLRDTTPATRARARRR